ncbi:class I SAM-dependent methyltransferase [Candidatus Woesearchaeota archaeon]|nr:class I SAM-dependent methyltransferase [Candidatus Woesearchaeota archaeon]
MDRLGELQKTAASIDGWLSPAEGRFLYNSARKCPQSAAIVEIGSWKGKSTVWLASGSKDGNHAAVYAIDPHTGSSEHKKMFGKVWTFEEFKQNVKAAKVDGLVKPIVKTSEAAARNWDKKIGFLWIDGAHEYEMVLLDYKLWEPHLIDGGVIAFHDSQKGGPKKVVNRHLYFGSRFRNIGFVEGITYATKTSHLSIFDKFRNLYVLLLTSIYSFAGQLSLPRPVKALGNRMVKAML